MKRYSVGIIGCGDIGFLFDYKKKPAVTEGAFTHFKAFRSSDKFEVKAVSELNKEIRNIILKEYKIPAYDNYKLMLEENEFDVLVIATNDESHAEILKNIINHKPKLVFCEKPLALSLEEVKRLTALYKKNKIHLQINYTRRFLEEFFEIENIIKKKLIGEIESMTFYYSRGLMHNASHYIDLVNRYIGETEKNLIKISEKKGITESDPTVSFEMIFKNGIEVKFIGLNPTKLSFAEIDIVGTKGRIKVNYKNEIEKYKVTENKVYKGYMIYEMTGSVPINFSVALPNAVENIYKVLSGKAELKSSAENSIKIFELIKRIKEKNVCQN